MFAIIMLAFVIGIGIAIMGLVIYFGWDKRMGNLIAGIIGFVVAMMAVVPMSVGVQSLTDMSRDTMNLVVSGEYKIDKDCWGKETEKIGDKLLAYSDF
jgi:hypothetical protein